VCQQSLRKEQDSFENTARQETTGRATTAARHRGRSAVDTDSQKSDQTFFLQIARLISDRTSDHGKRLRSDVCSRPAPESSVLFNFERLEAQTASIHNTILCLSALLPAVRIQDSSRS